MQVITFETVVIEAFIFHASKEPFTGCVVWRTAFLRHGPY